MNEYLVIATFIVLVLIATEIHYFFMKEDEKNEHN